MLRRQFLPLFRRFALGHVAGDRFPVTIGLDGLVITGTLITQRSHFNQMREVITSPERVMALIENESIENPDEEPYNVMVQSDDFHEPYDDLFILQGAEVFQNGVSVATLPVFYGRLEAVVFWSLMPDDL